MTVFLVGAGPGDPGLITVRGAEALRGADVVVHDRLAEVSLLDLAPAGAERIDVGKSPGGPVDQAAINDLLVELGRAGKQVVRLKGGDPFVFGRGGEEAEALLAAGVRFEVVPGITSAVAVPAYAGIPLTHRGLSTSFTVVTGHSRHAVDNAIDWESLARAGDTIVVLMGVAHREEISRRLIAGGRLPTTPVAATRWGTRSEQQTVRTDLAGLPAAPLEPPSTIVIGEVAGLHLRWFEERPLLGRTVVVTRATDQAGSLAGRLRDLGAAPLVVPTIAIAGAADDGSALAAAVADVARFEWVTFTSANAVSALFEHVLDARALGGVRVAAVGPATAAALRSRGIEADLVPDRSTAAALAEAFPSTTADGRVLLPQADRAGPELAEGVRARGWTVEVVEAYRTVTVPVDAETLAAAVDADALCLTSASTATGWAVATGGVAPKVVVSIGPMTTAAAEAAGLRVTAEAESHDLDGLIAALVRALS